MQLKNILKVAEGVNIEAMVDMCDGQIYTDCLSNITICI